MSFSFLKLLGLGKDELPALLVLHDDFVMTAQLDKKETVYKLVGFNKMSLEEGVVQNGEISDLDKFQEILKQLFLEAKPSPIKPKKLFVNIPFQLLYPFVKDLSNRVSKDVIEAALLENINKNSPISAEDLSLHYSSYENTKFTYGVIGAPKKWEERLGKACKSSGVNSIDFIAEPYARLIPKTESSEQDFVLFSYHTNQIFVSIFHNGVLYDSYFIDTETEDGKLDFSICFSEFQQAQESFKVRFNKKIKHICFVGFENKYQEQIKKYFSEQDDNLEFFNEKQSSFYNVFPAQHDTITLIGLAEKAFKKK